jgi:hypothetical protein
LYLCFLLGAAPTWELFAWGAFSETTLLAGRRANRKRLATAMAYLRNSVN